MNYGNLGSSDEHQKMSFGLRLCLAIAGTWVAVLAAWFAIAGSPEFPLDDAYIVQHAVAGVLEGGSTRFVDSTPLSGLTSPLHVLLVAVGALALPIAWSQFAVGILAWIVYGVCLWRLARSADVPDRWAAWLVVAGLFTGYSAYHAINGLETGLAMASATLALLFTGDERRRRSLFALLGFLPFIRPELIALALALALHAAWLAYRQHRLNQLIQDLPWLLLGPVICVGFLAVAGGPIVPNSASAKAYFFAEGCHARTARWTSLVLALDGFVRLIGPLAVGFLLLPFARQRIVASLFLLAFITAYFANLPDALTHNAFRYLHLLLPVCLAGWVGALGHSSRPIRRITQVGLVVATVYATIGLGENRDRYSADVAFSRGELHGVASWVAANIPAASPVLVHDAGYISLRGEQPLVDLVGLKTRSSVAAHRRHTFEECSRTGAALDEIAKANGVQFLVVLNDWDLAFSITRGLRRQGWVLTRVDGIRGESSYRVYRMTPPAK